MSTFLKLLPLELSEIKDIIEPDMPLEPKDKQIGVLTDDTTRRLFTMWKNMSKLSEQYELDAKYANSIDRPLLSSRARELNEKSHVVGRLLYISVNDMFGLWDNYIGFIIKQGWVIVAHEPQDEGMPPLFKGLFGQ
jgi:hypothetical protein